MGRLSRRPAVLRNISPISFRFPQRKNYPYGPDTRPARQTNFDAAPQKKVAATPRIKKVGPPREAAPTTLYDGFSGIRWAAVGGGPYGV